MGAHPGLVQHVPARLTPVARRARLSVPIVAVATLAIGIGTATAVVTVAEALLVRPLPVAREQELVVLWGTTPDGQFPNVPLTLPEVQDLRRTSRTLRSIAYHTFRGASTGAFVDDDQAFQLRVAMVSGNWFDVLSARPALGATFGPADDTHGSPPVLVLSHRAWQQRFGGDSAVIGRSIRLATTGHAYRIVAVMPPGLEYPRGVELWTPLSAWSSEVGSYDLASNELDLVGRLAAGATPAQARDELTTFFARVDSPGWRQGARAVTHGFRESILGETMPAMRLVMLAAATLLLIACVNATNLLLLRATDRAHALVIRAALGASRRRLVVRQLGESARLALAAGVTGTLFAVVLVKSFVVLAPPSLPRLETIAPNGAVLFAAVAMTVICLAVAGLAPAVVASRVDPGEALRAGTRQTMGRRIRLVGELLVATQVGLAVVALSAAALVARSFANLQGTELRFDAGQLMVAELALPRDRFGDPGRGRDLLGRITDRLTSAPGVRDVAPVLSIPFVGAGGGIDGRVALPGQSPDEAAQNPIVNMDVVTPSFFRTVGTPVLEGRPFSDADRDGAPRVVIVSRATANALWPGRDPLGQRVVMQGELTVVGVVPDTRYRDLLTDRPTVYFPLAQSVFPVSPTRLLVRTDNAAEAVARIRQVLNDVDRSIALSRVASVHEHLDAAWAQPRLNSIILAVFATAALCLAGAGLFSVMAAMVRRRTRELAIRMALGASRRAVTRLVVLRGALVAAVGAGAGVVLARAAGGMLSALLYGIEATDAATMTGVVAVVLVTAIAASLSPARSGARVDPARVLRADG